MNRERWSHVLMRVVLGVIFMAHGLAKLNMGVDNVAGWFQSIGLPGFFAHVVVYLEILGGAALIVGLLTRLVSAAFVVLMLGAIVKVKWGAGLVGSAGGAGYALDLALLVMALHLAVTGSQALALDRLWQRRGAGREVTR